MRTADFDFDLPPELIAQEPLPERSMSRMLVLHRATGHIEHRCVAELPEYLAAPDVLVMNDTRVIPARLFGRRCDTGGKVELLLLEPVGADEWLSLYRASGRARVGLELELADGLLEGAIIGTEGGGHVRIRLSGDRPLMDVLELKGVPPLPPYIRREGADTVRTAADRERYQTVYACSPGAVAAPTAGLHFTDELLSELARRGVARAHVTLHVGPGTFKPVKAEDVREHVMDSERYVIGRGAVEAIAGARAVGGRVVAVGSTSVRTLESVASRYGELQADEGRSALFIYPPYTFRIVDAMLTNFHLPRSTLLMMVSAFAGRECVLEAYRAAIAERYRFYSYGDCMLIV